MRLSLFFVVGALVASSFVSANAGNNDHVMFPLSSALLNKDIPTLLTEGQKALDNGDIRRAISFFNYCSRQDSPEACRKLVEIYSDQRSPVYDFSMAWELRKKLFTLGDVDAMLYIARVFMDSEEYVESAENILNYLYNTDAADKTLPDLAELYAFKLKDYSKALKFATEGSEKGDYNCLYVMSKLYEDGNGVTADAAKAQEYLYRAAEAGHPEAGLAAGIKAYDNKEYDKAFNCFRKSAEGGIVSAMAWVGRCYGYGEGTSQDYDEAAYWLDRAAMEGSPMGNYELSRLYLYGLGVPRNVSKAFDLMGQATKSRYADSESRLNTIRMIMDYQW